MPSSGRADTVNGSSPPNSDPEHSSGVGSASITGNSYWPLQSHLDLGAFPSAVPSARLHARFIVEEWGLAFIADTVELIVSELVTNGVKASQQLEGLPAIRLGLSSDERSVLVTVWDGNHEPVGTSAVEGSELPDLETEGGRGLFLVDNLSTDWGVYQPENVTGKVVWSVVTASEEDIAAAAERRRQVHGVLPKRVPHLYELRRPAQVMNELEVLRRVREGLRGLE